MDAGVQRQSPQAAAALGAILSTGRLTGANGSGETQDRRRGGALEWPRAIAPHWRLAYNSALVWDKAVRRPIAFLFLWLCLAHPAFADSRVALVIGNSAYAGVGALSNPKNDAALVAATLGGEGFKVTLVQDANRIAMLKALRGFSDEADQADWALVYYAGHGIEVGGVNYLLPIDVELREDRDAQDEAISLNRVLDAVASAHKLRLVILDACRNNPFAATMKRSIYTRAVVDRGLAPADPPAGILVVYAAEAGQVAEDGASGHSPFTAALAHVLQEPGLEVRRLFDAVTADVIEATGGHQRPYQYGSNPSREAFYFAPPVSASPSISDSAIAAAIDAATSVDQLTSLIALLPEGRLKERAQARAEALKQTQTSNAGESPSLEVASLEGASPAGSWSALPQAPTPAPTAAEQQATLRSVTLSHSLRSAGASGDADQIGEDEKAEANRDYTSRVDDLIARIKQAHSAQHSTMKLDVTEHAILESLETSIREANLVKFETFLDENWSAERLRIMILDRVQNEIGTLFEGANRDDTTMNNIDQIIRKAADNVYARLFEMSELLAANRSSALFVQRLYQTHGDFLDDEVRKSADQSLSDASASGVAPLEPLLQGNPNSFALRYRAERIIYDCLSDNVEAISSIDSGVATWREIIKGVADVTQQQCSKWLSAQLIGADGKIKSQDPMPQRAVWSAQGPMDDPSMYERATDHF